MTVKMMNKSVAMRTAENSSSLNISDIALITDNFKNKAEWYGQRLVNFLKDNITTYPEYLSIIQPAFGTILPKRTSYTCGMFLDSDDTLTPQFLFPR